MQRLWSADELGERWSLLPEDLALLAGRVDAGKLGFAVQLAFWRSTAAFPTRKRKRTWRRRSSPTLLPRSA